MPIGSSPTLFPIRPRIISDEIYSSWLYRQAEALGITYRELLLHHVGVDPIAFNVDFDNSRDVVTVFALLTGQDSVRLDESRPGHAYKGTEAKSPPYQMQCMFLQAAAAGPVAYGYAFCPDCISTDHVPYFRKSWAYAFHVICPTHLRQLFDRCACGQAANYARAPRHRMDPADFPLAVCSNCRKPRTGSPINQYSLKSRGSRALLNLQAEGAKLLERGYLKLPDMPRASPAEVMSLVDPILGSFARQRWARRPEKQKRRRSRLSGLRQLSMAPRVQVLRRLAWIFWALPDSFYSFCRKRRVRIPAALKALAHIKFAEHLLSDALERRSREVADRLALYNRVTGSSTNPAAWAQSRDKAVIRARRTYPVRKSAAENILWLRKVHRRY